MKSFLNHIEIILPKIDALMMKHLIEDAEKLFGRKKVILQNLMRELADKHELSRSLEVRRKLKELQNIKGAFVRLRTLNQQIRQQYQEDLKGIISQIIQTAKVLLQRMNKCSCANNRVEMTNQLIEMEELLVSCIDLYYPIGEVLYEFCALQYESRYRLYKNPKYRELIVQCLSVNFEFEREIPREIAELANLFEISTTDYSGIKIVDEIIARIQESIIDDQAYQLMTKLPNSDTKIKRLVLTITQNHIRAMRDNNLDANDKQIPGEKDKFGLTFFGPWIAFEKSVIKLLQ